MTSNCFIKIKLILVRIQEFGEFRESLGIDEGSPTFTLFESRLNNTTRKGSRAKKQENASNDPDD